MLCMLWVCTLCMLRVNVCSWALALDIACSLSRCESGVGWVSQGVTLGLCCGVDISLHIMSHV